MAPYKNILLSKDLGRRRFWYIHGSDQALIRDAFELARSHIECKPFETAVTVFFGDSVDQTELEYRLLTTVLEDRSLVILYKAEKYSNWDRLLVILNSLPGKSFFIALSDEEDVDKSENLGKFFSQSSKARLVDCDELPELMLIHWIETRLAVRRDAIRFLIARSNGDTEWLLNTIRKLEYFKGVITLELLEKVITSEGTPQISTALLGFRKSSALHGLEQGLIPNSSADIINSIRDAALLNAAAKVVGRNPKLLFEKTRLSSKRIAFLKSFSRFYDRKNTLRTSELLYNMYPMLRSGDKTAWQSIISRW